MILKISGVVICVKIYNRGLSTVLIILDQFFSTFKTPQSVEKKGKDYFQGFSLSKLKSSDKLLRNLRELKSTQT
jgi:hypothetical protein